MAMWSVLSLLIKYCGSSFEARTIRLPRTVRLSHTKTLILIYSEPGGAGTRRDNFFDSEGNVIAYPAGFSPERKTFTFLSGVVASAPRYLLTYMKEGTDRLSIKFEIAPPGKPNPFAPTSKPSRTARTSHATPSPWRIHRGRAYGNAAGPG